MLIKFNHPLAQKLLTQLRNPLKLRFTCVIVLWLVGYRLLWNEETKIHQIEGQIAVETKRMAVCQEFANLHRQMEIGNKRVWKCAQENEWVQEIMTETRTANLLVSSIDAKPSEIVVHGPYTSVGITMDIMGSYTRFLQFIRWCDSPERAIRVNIMSMRGEGGLLSCKLSFCGLLQKSNLEQPEDSAAPNATTPAAKPPQPLTTRTKKNETGI